MSSSKLHPAPPPFPCNILSATFPDKVTRDILAHHKRMDVRAARPLQDQWTVLACYFSFRRGLSRIGDEGDGEVELLSMATGVKCLGGNVADREGACVDMHAEILARRELEVVLLEEMTRLERTPEDGSDLLEIVHTEIGETPRFRKRPDTQLLLYTSHAPCGPASSAAHLARLGAEDAYLQACIAILSGSRSEKPVISSAAPSTFRRVKQDARPPPSKKPSRADAPPTPSYTCSDKLSRYQLLGLQGGRLAKYWVEGEALRLDGIIVGEDYDEKGLRYLFGGAASQGEDDWSRLREGLSEITSGETNAAGLSYIQPLLTHPFHIWPTTLPFPHGRLSLLSSHPDPLLTPPTPTSLSLLGPIDPTLPLPLLRDILLPKPPIPIQPFSIASHWHRGATCQLIAPTGYVGGVSKKVVEREGERARWSRVGRGRMWEAFEAFVREVLGVDGGGERDKGNEGWKVVNAWMEEKGPFKGWHRLSSAQAAHGSCA